MHIIHDLPGKKSYQNLHNANHHSTRLQGICFQIPPVSHRPCSTHILPASLRRRILLAATAFDSPAGREGMKEGYMRARLPKPKEVTTEVWFFFSCGGAWKHVYKSYIFASVHIHCITLYIHIYTYIKFAYIYRFSNKLATLTCPEQSSWPTFRSPMAVYGQFERTWVNLGCISCLNKHLSSPILNSCFLRKVTFTDFQTVLTTHRSHFQVFK